MKIQVGPLFYDVFLVHGFLICDGKNSLGLCDCDRMVIHISDVPPPSKRISIFWHELAHAAKNELDIHQSASLDEEPFANLIGLLMANVSPSMVARIHILLTHGIECDSIIISPNIPEPIPVFKYNGQSINAFRPMHI